MRGRALAPHGVPAMRKDFLVDPYQVYEARAAGAGGVLLILRMLDDAALRALLDCARELGLFVLLEGFDAADIARGRAALAARRVRARRRQLPRSRDARASSGRDLRGLAPLLPAASARASRRAGSTTPEDARASRAPATSSRSSAAR